MGVLQFSYDAHHLEVAQTPQGKGSVPQDYPPLQISIASPRLSPVLLTNWLQTGGACDPSLLGLDDLLEQLTELWETLDLKFLIHYK